MKLSLRAKTVVILVATTLGPVIAAVLFLLNAVTRPVRDAEQMLQAAVVNEVADEPMRPLHEVEKDAKAVAAVFARAADGAIRDDAAIESVRALIGDRERISAVRFEVPSAGVSTVLHWLATAEAVPQSTPELRSIADETGMAVSVTGPTRGAVVARVRPATGKRVAAGYVTVYADLERIRAALEEIAASRFGGAVSLVVATHDRKAVAAVGVPGVAPGDGVEGLPIWKMMHADAPVQASSSITFEFVDGKTPMVGAIRTIPETGWVVASWRPQSIAYRALTDMGRRGLLVTALAAVLAVIVGVAAAGGVTAPILRIVGQVRLIAQRKWRELAPAPPRSDELGELARSLGEMAHDLEQGEIEAKLRGDLSRFMSKQLVDAIVKGEHPLSLGGKRAVISVVFADVVGFTPLAEARDAEQMVALLNELFSVLTEIVFRHGGTVDKFIGDCIMAVWGAPVAQPDHASRALGAAEDMMRFLETANEGWRDKYDLEIRLGIGVNSGEAIVGNIGSDKRMEYTVIGDAVNVAARLESIAQPNQVLVAASTRDLVGEAFALRLLGERKLTGRKTDTAVYELELD